MYYVYVLICKRTNKLYVGYSSDLKRRLREHLTNNVYTTKRLANKDLELIFYEAFLNKKDAQRREVYLKSTKGKRALKLMLRNYFHS